MKTETTTDDSHEEVTGSDEGGDSSISNMDVGDDDAVINDEFHCSASNSVVTLCLLS